MTGSSSNGVVLWHPETDRRIKIKRDHGSGGLSFSPDSTLLAFGGWQKSINVLEVGTLRLRGNFTGYQLGANALAWTPDGTNLLSIGLAQAIKLWNVPPAKTNGVMTNILPDRPDIPPQRSFFGHQAPVSTLALSGDGQWMVSGSLDRTILLWRPAPSTSDENPVVLPGGRFNRHLEPVSGCVVSYSNQTLVVWNPAAAGIPARPLPGTENMLHAGSLAGGGSFAAIHPGSRDAPFRLEIRGLPDGRVLSRREIPELTDPAGTTPGSLTRAAISPDGQWLALTRPAGSHLHDLSGRRRQPSLQPLIQSSNGIVQRMLFSPDSRWLVLTQNAADNSSITIIDMSAWETLPSFKLSLEPDSLTAAVTDPTSRYLATGGDRQDSIRVWELKTGRRLGSCNGNAVQGGLVWSADGQTLASVGYLGLKLWSSRYYRELATLEPRSGFIPCGFTADGRSLISFSQEGQVRQHTVPTLKEILTLRQR